MLKLLWWCRLCFGCADDTMLIVRINLIAIVIVLGHVNDHMFVYVFVICHTSANFIVNDNGAYAAGVASACCCVSRLLWWMRWLGIGAGPVVAFASVVCVWP